MIFRNKISKLCLLIIGLLALNSCVKDRFDIYNNSAQILLDIDRSEERRVGKEC